MGRQPATDHLPRQCMELLHGERITVVEPGGGGGGGVVTTVPTPPGVDAGVDRQMAPTRGERNWRG